MSNISNILSDPTTGSILGIVGICATAAVGFTVYLMQQRADRNVNDIIHHEDERKKTIKRYFMHRIDADFKRINKHCNDLKQHTEKYLENKSDESWNVLKRYADEFFPDRVNGFITVTNDINKIVPLLDSPRLIDKFMLIIYYGDELKGYARELGANKNRDNNDFKDIENQIDDVMHYICDLRDLLLKEVDYKLD